MSDTTMERLGSFRAADGVSAIFRGEGRLVRGQEDARYMAAFDEALGMYDRLLHGNRRDIFAFSEAMSTSDFQYLFADIIQRSALGMYAEWTPVWDKVAKRGSRLDFRTGRAFVLDGAEAALPKVKELADYTSRAVTDGKYDYAVEKYGATIGVSWESWINDDLEQLRTLPERLSKGARMTEEKFATTLYAGASGPDATFFSSGHANLMTAKLSTGSLQEAIRKIYAQTDADGNPVFTGRLRLVVPPALEITALNILNATQIWAATGGGDGTGNDQMQVQNWVPQKVAEAVTNPWLPIVSSSANGDTSWYLFADPGVGRPAMEVGFLRGNEAPSLFVKSPNAMRVGSGLINPEEGDFDNDGIEWKIRHVLGGTTMEYRAALASSGTTAAL